MHLNTKPGFVGKSNVIPAFHLGDTNLYTLITLMLHRLLLGRMTVAPLKGAISRTSWLLLAGTVALATACGGSEGECVNELYEKSNGDTELTDSTGRYGNHGTLFEGSYELRANHEGELVVFFINDEEVYNEQCSNPTAPGCNELAEKRTMAATFRSFNRSDALPRLGHYDTDAEDGAVNVWSNEDGNETVDYIDQKGRSWARVLFLHLDDQSDTAKLKIRSTAPEYELLGDDAPAPTPTNINEPASAPLCEEEWDLGIGTYSRSFVRPADAWLLGSQVNTAESGQHAVMVADGNTLVAVFHVSLQEYIEDQLLYKYWTSSSLNSFIEWYEGDRSNTEVDPSPTPEATPSESSPQENNSWYEDLDGDGYTPANGDCDDLNPNAYLGATELCDGFDNDCDHFTDEPDAEDARPFYIDEDGDNFGDPERYLVGCKALNGFVDDDSDCDDTDDSVHPDAEEVCDGLDNNCDGEVDEGFDVICVNPADRRSFPFFAWNFDDEGNSPTPTDTAMPARWLR